MTSYFIHTGSRIFESSVIAACRILEHKGIPIAVGIKGMIPIEIRTLQDPEDDQLVKISDSQSGIVIEVAPTIINFPKFRKSLVAKCIDANLILYKTKKQTQKTSERITQSRKFSRTAALIAHHVESLSTR